MHAWEDSNKRPYFANSKGSACEDVVWRQGVRSEAATGEGNCAASLLSDMSAFYEHFKLDKLEELARRLKCEPTVVKLAMSTYRGARHFVSGQRVLEAAWAEIGMPAGCQFATWWVKVYMIEGAD